MAPQESDVPVLLPPPEMIIMDSHAEQYSNEEPDSPEFINEIVFLKSKAPNISANILRSFLKEEMNNENRLHNILVNILEIPNVEEDIRKFVSSPSTWSDIPPSEVVDSSESPFCKRVREMFPDVDDDFVKSECKDLKSQGDLALFVNDVMLTGTYPKRCDSGDSRQNRVENESSSGVRFIGSVSYAPTVYSSDEDSPSDEPLGSKAGEKGKQVDGAAGGVELPLMLVEGTADGSERVVENPSSPVEGSQKSPSFGSQGRPASNRPADSLNSPSTSNELGRCEGPAATASFRVYSLEEWVEEKTAELIRLFPANDPTFLRSECLKFNMSTAVMNEFVLAKLEKNDMPTMADYEKRVQFGELMDRYTKNFSIDDFLKVIPDPWAYFSDPKRNSSYKFRSYTYLTRAFSRERSREQILSVFRKNENHLYLACKQLARGRKNRRWPNINCDFMWGDPPIQFFQEVAFIRNEKKIKEHIEMLNAKKRMKFEEAKKMGSLLECQCCYDAEVMIEDTVYCPNDHCFCKDCVVKFVDVELAQGKFEYKCLLGCGEKFTLTSLQNVLRRQTFSNIVRTIQAEEIKAAGIEGLVQCPFCNYATIMPPEISVLSCLNPECQKESCRFCKELNHIPLRCNEVERSEQVKARTYIEDRMTEALVRTCYKCQKKFVKEDGCNKVVCSCGAQMCYICRQPVTGYDHFNSQGNTEYHKCPLFSTNDELHVELIEQIGKEAKAEILNSNPDVTLLHDPTTILPKRGYDAPISGVNRGAALQAALNAIRRYR